MEYQHIRHDFGPNTPVEEYLEIGEHGWELQKVEVFADGHLTYGDDIVYTGQTGLSEVEAYSLDRLNAMPRVVARAIDATEFEQVWDRAHREPFTPRRLR
jgi:hypothetical protein